MNLKIITPSQGIINTNDLPTAGAGVDFNRFFLGSEGTLGVITEAKIKILKLPKFRASS